jgi:hypothetical protein
MSIRNRGKNAQKMLEILKTLTCILKKNYSPGFCEQG